MPSKSWVSRRILIAATFAGFFVSSATLAVTVVVTSTADTVTSCSTTGSGEVGGAGCTLRDAITFSNANPPTPPAQNFIQFNIPGSGVQTIVLSNHLPAITTATIVDGYSQPGASPNTLAVGDNAALLIHIFGNYGIETTNAPPFTITGGTGSVIQGLILDRQNDPSVEGAIGLFSCCNQILGSFIGVDPTGSFSGSNLGGIEVLASRNRIGGLDPADRNVLSGGGESSVEVYGECSGNQDGFVVAGVVTLLSDDNIVEGNYIGLSASGLAGTGPGSPGIIVASSSNFIHRNAIADSLGDGVSIAGDDNIVSGNLIGTDATGTEPVPNSNQGIGIYEGRRNAIGTSLSLIAPLSIFEGNRIAFNVRNGIAITEDPAACVLSALNSILSNSVFSNGGLGIDLGANGVTPDDPCDTDSGPNELRNFPDLTGALATSGKTVISGTLNSNPNTNYRIQLFANQACDPSGFGEGETLVGDLFLTTDSSCNASFQTSVPGELVGQFITATATDPAGNTSEFSECQPVIRLTRTLTRIPIRGPVRVAPGVPVEFPFEVRPPSPNTPGPLSGEVIVFDDAGDTCRADVSPTGEGRCSLTFGAPGHYLVRAQYLGNAQFEESTSPPVPALVGMPGGGP